jgi:hypothetical protein
MFIGFLEAEFESPTQWGVVLVPQLEQWAATLGDTTARGSTSTVVPRRPLPTTPISRQTMTSAAPVDPNVQGFVAYVFLKLLVLTVF